MASDMLLLPVTEAIRRLGIGPTSFWKIVKNGEIRVRKIGRRTLVEQGELSRYIEALPSTNVRAAR